MHGAAAGEFFILRRRDAEAIERGFIAGDFAHELVIEQGCKLCVEEAALIGECL